MKKFILKMALITILVIIVSMLADKFIPLFDLSIYAWIMPVFFLILTIGSYALVFYGKSGKPAAFFARVSGGMMLRMFFCIIFIAIYLYFSEVANIPIVIYFMFLYFIYTTFEIYDLVYKLRSEKTTSKIAEKP